MLNLESLCRIFRRRLCTHCECTIEELRQEVKALRWECSELQRENKKLRREHTALEREVERLL